MPCYSFEKCKGSDSNSTEGRESQIWPKPSMLPWATLFIALTWSRTPVSFVWMNHNFTCSLCGHTRGVLPESVMLNNGKLSWSSDYVYIDILQDGRDDLPNGLQEWCTQTADEWMGEFKRLDMQFLWATSWQRQICPLTNIKTLSICLCTCRLGLTIVTGPIAFLLFWQHHNTLKW